MLQIDGIMKSFGPTPVLQHIDLTIGDGEIVCLLGPSGCGKTTLLRVIAGLEQPEAGDVRLRGESILGLPAHRRDFGLMFQDFALFPHMNVAQNVGFGLKMHHAVNLQARVDEVLSLVGLHGFDERDVSQLSGGERQRVALARSLAPGPQLLMLDEPLGSLDANLRERLVVELRKIIKQVGLTAIYVTHDQNEAFAIADHIAVMNAGHIEQVDRPEILYRQPRTAFVARFLGLNNVIEAEEVGDGQVRTALGTFSVSGEPYAILLHPLGIRLVDSGDCHTVTGQVIDQRFIGDSYRLTVQHESATQLLFKVPSDARNVPSIGDDVVVCCEWVVPLRA